MLPDPNFDIHSRRQPTATKRYLHNPSTNINDHKKESVYMYHVSRTPVFFAWTRLSRGKDIPRSRKITIVSLPYRPTVVRVIALSFTRRGTTAPRHSQFTFTPESVPLQLLSDSLPRSTPVRFPARFYRPPAIHSLFSPRGSGRRLPVCNAISNSSY